MISLNRKITSSFCSRVRDIRKLIAVNDQWAHDKYTASNFRIFIWPILLTVTLHRCAHSTNVLGETAFSSSIRLASVEWTVWWYGQLKWIHSRFLLINFQFCCFETKFSCFVCLLFRLFSLQIYERLLRHHTNVDERHTCRERAKTTEKNLGQWNWNTSLEKLIIY